MRWRGGGGARPWPPAVAGGEEEIGVVAINSDNLPRIAFLLGRPQRAAQVASVAAAHQASASIAGRVSVDCATAAKSRSAISATGAERGTNDSAPASMSLVRP